MMWCLPCISQRFLSVPTGSRGQFPARSSLSNSLIKLDVSPSGISLVARAPDPERRLLDKCDTDLGGSVYIAAESKQVRTYKVNLAQRSLAFFQQTNSPISVHPGAILGLSANGRLDGTGILWTVQANRDASDPSDGFVTSNRPTRGGSGCEASSRYRSSRRLVGERLEYLPLDARSFVRPRQRDDRGRGGFDPCGCGNVACFLHRTKRRRRRSNRKL